MLLPCFVRRLRTRTELSTWSAPSSWLLCSAAARQQVVGPPAMLQASPCVAQAKVYKHQIRAACANYTKCAQQLSDTTLQGIESTPTKGSDHSCVCEDATWDQSHTTYAHGRNTHLLRAKPTGFPQQHVAMMLSRQPASCSSCCGLARLLLLASCCCIACCPCLLAAPTQPAAPASEQAACDVHGCCCCWQRRLARIQLLKALQDDRTDASRGHEQTLLQVDEQQLQHR